MNTKKIAILGSTGSIGTMTLKVASHLGDEIQVVALACRTNIDLLQQQISTYSPEVVAVWDEKKAHELQKRVKGTPVLSGKEGVIEVAKHTSADVLVSAASGFEGVLPTLAGIEAGKTLALANKEALVAAGKLVTDLVAQKGVALIPVDSEHTALFQCLKGEKRSDVRRMILTASGGPFLNSPADQIAQMQIEDALQHPNYRMGAKVTIDSSTLMNKGLEMIETHFLYDMPPEQIDVLVHPQQVVHSMVEYVDGSILSHMGVPDMHIPIQYALTHPDRKESLVSPIDFTKYPTLHFSPPDFDRFRCLKLAYDALRSGGSMPCFMNAANEVLVEHFLEGKIGWLEISQKLEDLMQAHSSRQIGSYDELAQVDRESRVQAQHVVGAAC